MCDCDALELSHNCRVQCNKPTLEKIQTALGLTLKALPTSALAKVSNKTLRIWKDALSDSIGGRVLERKKIIDSGGTPDKGHEDRLRYELNWQFTIDKAVAERGRAEAAKKNAERERESAAARAKAAKLRSLSKQKQFLLAKLRKDSGPISDADFWALAKERHGIDITVL